jgi:hypothetical protein
MLERLDVIKSPSLRIMTKLKASQIPDDVDRGEIEYLFANVKNKHSDLDIATYAFAHIAMPGKRRVCGGRARRPSTELVPGHHHARDLIHLRQRGLREPIEAYQTLALSLGYRLHRRQHRDHVQFDRCCSIEYPVCRRVMPRRSSRGPDGNLREDVSRVVL